jgi:hypothetical protein
MGETISDLLTGLAPTRMMGGLDPKIYFSNKLLSHNKISLAKEELSVQFTPEPKRYNQEVNDSEATTPSN